MSACPRCLLSDARSLSSRLCIRRALLQDLLTIVDFFLHTCFNLPHALTGSPLPGHNLMFTACSSPFMLCACEIDPLRAITSACARDRCADLMAFFASSVLSLICLASHTFIRVLSIDLAAQPYCFRFAPAQIPLEKRSSSVRCPKGTSSRKITPNLDVADTYAACSRYDSSTTMLSRTLQFGVLALIGDLYPLGVKTLLIRYAIS